MSIKLSATFLISFIWLNSFSQNLQGTAWKIDKIIGQDLNNVSEFTLIKADTTIRFWDRGNTIRFYPDGSYKCVYKSKCGKDCFPSSKGRYMIPDSSSITLFIEEFHQKGHCEKIERVIGKTIGTYTITRKEDETILLIKKADP